LNSPIFLSRENRPRQISRRICGRRNTRLRDIVHDCPWPLYMLRLSVVDCENGRAPLATFVRRARECVCNCREINADVSRINYRDCTGRMRTRGAMCVLSCVSSPASSWKFDAPLGRRPSHVRSRDKRISVFGNSCPFYLPLTSSVAFSVARRTSIPSSLTSP